MKKFQGFIWPEANWFRLPNNWTDITRRMKSIAEMKVVEYILRHTWGFQEFEEYRKITTEEFEKGRKRKDGTRLDKGTGLSNKSVYQGLKRAVEHGFLEVIVDDRDKARVKKFYRLKMKLLEDKDKTSYVNSTSRYVNSTELDVDSTDRTEKDTTKKDTTSSKRRSSEGGPTTLTPDLGFSRNGKKKRSKKLRYEEWDEKAGENLKEILVRYKTGIERTKVETLAHQVYLLRINGKVSKRRIKAVVTWLLEHYEDKFVPRLFKSTDFNTKFVRFEEAMERFEDDNSPETIEAQNIRDGKEYLNHRFDEGWVENYGSTVK